MARILIMLIFSLSLFALTPGQMLPDLSLKGDEGSKIDGTQFNSNVLRDKVHVIFYVDPDEKELNEAFSEALKAEKFDRSQFASVAIINMDATWLPNFALESALKKKQKKYPHTLYVKDMNKKGIKAWEIADDSSDIIITDRQGRVLYIYEGKIPKSEFSKIIALIKEHL